MKTTLPFGISTTGGVIALCSVLLFTAASMLVANCPQTKAPCAPVYGCDDIVGGGGPFWQPNPTGDDVWIPGHSCVADTIMLGTAPVTCNEDVTAKQGTGKCASEYYATTSTSGCDRRVGSCGGNKGIACPRTS